MIPPKKADRHLTKRILLGVVPLLTLGQTLGTIGVRAGELDFSGSIAAELRVFPTRPIFESQEKATFSPSFTLKGDFTYEWDKSKSRFTFVPFARVDSDDQNRNHFDVRELKFLHLGDGWDAVVGIDTVFWGVTESRHLVNIINQDDAVERLDLEDKLGQPMVNLNLERDFGTFSFFALPTFRERKYYRFNHRFAGPIKIDSDLATFDASNGKNHIDFAVRWQHILGDFELAVSYFNGTSREARLIPQANAGEQILVPHYDAIDQTAIEMQYVHDATLFKVEMITRSGHGDRFAAFVTGVEHTLYGVMGSTADLGIIAEYLYDGRDLATAPATSFDNDVFMGFRLAMNDLQDTSFLLGSIIDHKNGSTLISLEAERRVGDAWKVELETRWFVGINRQDPLYTLKRDNNFMVRLTRFF